MSHCYKRLHEYNIARIQETVQGCQISKSVTKHLNKLKWKLTQKQVMIFIKCTSVQIQTEGDRYCMAKPALALKEERGKIAMGPLTHAAKKGKRISTCFPICWSGLNVALRWQTCSHHCHRKRQARCRTQEQLVCITLEFLIDAWNRSCKHILWVHLHNLIQCRPLL